ncbi:MAG TPA: flippase [Roseiflexaceae bacterium]|nr:flippase [Roseiflexaceae bacterium]
MVLRNSAIGVVAQVAIKLLSFAFTVLIVRHLGAESYGQYAGVTAFGALFLFISDLGLSPFVVRRVAQLRDTPDMQAESGALYANVIVLRLLLSLLAGALMVTAAWLTGRPLIMVGAIALNVLIVLMYGVQGTSDAVLAGFERFDISASARVLNQFTFVVCGGIALALGLGYYGLIGATFVGVCLMTYLCWRGVRALGVQPGRVIARLWPGLLRASLPFGVIGFTLGLSYKFDTVLINIYIGDDATGYYNAAYNLVFSAAMISNIINTALYPSLTRQATSDPASLPKIVESTLRYLLVAALPIAVGGGLLAPQVIGLLYGAAYEPSAAVLALIMWVVPLMYLSEFLGYMVLVTGREGRAARSVLVSTSLNVACNLLLVPRFGLAAAAAMTVLTEAVLVGQYVWELRGLLRRVNWLATFLHPLLAALIMGALALLLARHLPFLAVVVVAAPVYLLLLMLLNVIGKNELRFLRGLRTSSEAPSTL